MINTNSYEYTMHEPKPKPYWNPYAAGLGLGIVLLQQSRVDEGVASLRRAIELDPDNAAARQALASAKAPDQAAGSVQ